MLQLNTASLYGVLRDFHILTKIRIVIFDAKFRELLAYPADREPFCTQLRQTPDGELACQKSDMEGCRTCAKTKEPLVYRCHAGLTEAVVPICDQSGVLAYVMFGQILDSEASKQAVCRAFPRLTEPAELLPVKTKEELDAAATVLQAITGFMMTNRWVTPGRSDFLRQLDSYIDDHLSQSIHAHEICAVFRISRTRLYRLCADYLGCGPAEHIRARRIHRAKELLRQTSLPITEIAYQTGFSDYNHFSRSFRAATGCSARQYRNESTA